MKTTTFALLLLNVLATFQSCDDVTAFGRRIDASVIKNATTIAMMYFILFFAGGMTISVYEGLPLSSCLFEAASAVGTVGLTLGITPKLHILSQIILIIHKYYSGFVGPISPKGKTHLYVSLRCMNILDDGSSIKNPGKGKMSDHTSELKSQIIDSKMSDSTTLQTVDRKSTRLNSSH